MGATIGRVAWRMATGDGRYWLGLDLLCQVEGNPSEGIPQSEVTEET